MCSWGAILTAIGDELGNADPPTRNGIVRAVTAGADALRHLGKCEIGDKTMYDAVNPFADALSDNVAQGMTLVPAWQAAAQTATTRARETSTLVPQLGRAWPLAERSIGTPDAGATSMALIVTTVGKVLAGNQSQQALTRTGVNG